MGQTDEAERSERNDEVGWEWGGGVLCSTGKLELEFFEN